MPPCHTRPCALGAGRLCGCVCREAVGHTLALIAIFDVALLAMRVRTMVASIGMLLAACTSRGAEASMNMDLADLKPLLKSVQRLTQNGFGDSEVEQVDGLARSLPVNQTKELQFQVVFRGSNAS